MFGMHGARMQDLCVFVLRLVCVQGVNARNVCARTCGILFISVNLFALNNNIRTYNSDKA